MTLEKDKILFAIEDIQDQVTKGETRFCHIITICDKIESFVFKKLHTKGLQYFQKKF